MHAPASTAEGDREGTPRVVSNDGETIGGIRKQASEDRDRKVRPFDEQTYGLERLVELITSDPAVGSVEHPALAVSHILTDMAHVPAEGPLYTTGDVDGRTVVDAFPMLRYLELWTKRRVSPRTAKSPATMTLPSTAIAFFTHD